MMKKVILGATFATAFTGAVICATLHRKYLKGKLKRGLARFVQSAKERKVEKDVKKNKIHGNLDNVIKL